MFANPQGNEMWVLLLEKAFAKFCGNYGCLDGGHTLWAMQAMTGCYCSRFEFERSADADKNEYEIEKQDIDDEDEDEFAEEEEEEEFVEDVNDNNKERYSNISEVQISECWKRWNIIYNEPSNIVKNDYAWYDTGEAFDNNRMWSILKKYDAVGALISASATNVTENKREDGIIEGHAYTIKYVREIKNFKLLHMRNPWGSFEWNGMWSDNSTQWEKYKSIAEKLNFVAENDGAFWISFKDFINIFNVVEICDRSSIKNLHINIHEDEGKYGVCKGCMQGCSTFWCKCRGCKDIYCGRISSHKTVNTENKWLKKFCPSMEQNIGKAWTEN